MDTGEILDGLGMAETTPGPLIMVLQFVRFLAAYREAGSPPCGSRPRPIFTDRGIEALHEFLADVRSGMAGSVSS